MRIVVSGYMVRCPLGGYLWQTAHYLLGLRALGHDVWFYEDTGYDPLAYNPLVHNSSSEYGYGVRVVAEFLNRLGIGEQWLFVDVQRGVTHGPAAAVAGTLLQDADLLLNMGGVNRIPPERRRDRASAYIDLDPGYTQLRVANGDRKLAAMLDEHHPLFTIGENIGTPRSSVPTGDYRWRPTRQPVVVELWTHPRPARAAYTTIGKWDAPDRDLHFAGETYEWRKRTQFLRYLELPKTVSAELELAMDVDGIPGDRELFTAHGWRVVDPRTVSTDPWCYRDYIAESRGELTLAKDMTVRLRAGWFSDRSACYLAAGRPAIEQDTAFGDVLPLGPGLHAFATPAEAAAAVELVETDYAAAQRYARAVAHEYFNAETVLRKLLDDC